jgi:NADH:ubiquinone oxidoreductase subunit 2 (subunit N)
MQNNSESFLCPQVTVCVIAVLDVIFAIGSSSYINGGVFLLPIIEILVAVFVILGIKNRNYGFYNCAQITCIVISVIQTIFVVIIMLVLFSASYEAEKKDKDNNPESARAVLTLALFIILFFVWLESCVLICYNQRVRLYCDNIPINNMNNQVAQPLV